MDEPRWSGDKIRPKYILHKIDNVMSFGSCLKLASNAIGSFGDHKYKFNKEMLALYEPESRVLFLDLRAKIDLGEYSPFYRVMILNNSAKLLQGKDFFNIVSYKIRPRIESDRQIPPDEKFRDLPKLIYNL
jgi:hypothetical protein